MADIGTWYTVVKVVGLSLPRRFKSHPQHLGGFHSLVHQHTVAFTSVQPVKAVYSIMEGAQGWDPGCKKVLGHTLLKAPHEVLCHIMKTEGPALGPGLPLETT